MTAADTCLGAPAVSRTNTPRRHHYVPEMLQKNFAGSDRQLWFFDKKEAAFGVRRRPIKRLMRDWHLYTTISPTGARDTSTETRLSKLETKAEPILDRIIQRARSGQAPGLSFSDREHLSSFFIAQLRRSPDHFAGMLKKFEVAGSAARHLEELEALVGEKASDEIRAQLLGARSLKRISDNLLAGTAAEPLPFSLDMMMQRGFVAARIPKPARSFVLGSNPIVQLRGSSGRNGISDPTAEVWLPIAPDVALFSYGDARVDHLIQVTSDGFLRSFNVALAAQSSVIVSSSRHLILSLSRRFPVPRQARPPGPDLS